MGKRNQRRNYTEESSAPKRRKTGEESYTCSRKATGDVDKTSNMKRKEVEECLRIENECEKKPEKKRKTQTIIEKYFGQTVEGKQGDRVDKCKDDARVNGEQSGVVHTGLSDRVGADVDGGQCDKANKCKEYRDRCE